MDTFVQYYLNIGTHYQLNIDKLIYIYIYLVLPKFPSQIPHKTLAYLFICVKDDDGKSKLDLFLNTHATIVIVVILQWKILA
jgi:hypothetical protein